MEAGDSEVGGGGPSMKSLVYSVSVLAYMGVYECY